MLRNRLTYFFTGLSFLLLGALLNTTQAAAEFATPKEAEAMVKKAVEQIKTAGAEKTYSDITKKQNGLADRDLYITVYNMTGTVLAHGQVEKMVGKNLIDLTDVSGKQFIRERIEMGKSKNNFWQDYKFVDPVTKQVLPKQMYCERLNDTLVCGGVYKR